MTTEDANDRRAHARPPVEEIIRQAEDHANNLHIMSQKVPTKAECVACPAADVNMELARAVSLLTRMVTPIYKAFFNGGIPAKKAGKAWTIQTPVGLFKVSGHGAATWVFRVLVAFMLLKQLGYQVNLKDVLVKTEEQRAAIIQAVDDATAMARPDNP